MGEHVSIGEGRVLMAGTMVNVGSRIGRMAFIQAGQVVVRDVPDGATLGATVKGEVS